VGIQILLNGLRERLRRFRSARGGNVALTFALATVPLTGAVGTAVDYSRANNLRSQLLAAADAAAVGSVTQSSAAFKTAPTMSGDGEIKAGSTDAANIFNAVITGKSGFNNLKITANVIKTGSNVTSTVSFTAKVPTTFLGIFAKKNIQISGTSKAAHGVPAFIDFYLLLDNTPSMGVAATPADVAKMVANTPDQCAFACHDLSTAPNDYYSKAKSLGVTIRIDVLRTATQKLMDTAQSTATFSGQFRTAIYTFGTSCTLPTLTAVSPLTSNLSGAKTAAANIDLMTVPFQGYNSDQCTIYNDVLSNMNNAISSPGTGATAGTPQKYLFFVSDGVADYNNPTSCAKPTYTGGRCQEPIDTSFCTKIKGRGIKIAVLYTTYLPLPTNDWYNTWIAPFSKEIGVNMQSCASPGLYFEVSPTQGISDAMNALFQKAIAQAHLTQ
jgi:Flp pilus assembly protein TadG